MPERAKAPLLEWRKKKVQDLKGIERRTFSTDGMEIREADDGSLHLEGFACVTDVPYDVGWYEETIQRGAFTRTLSESPDVQLLINHSGMPLARTRSGTLRLEERTTPDANGQTGLWVDADLDPEDPDVTSLKRKMGRGDIDQMSFAFMQTGQKWNDDYTARLVTGCSIHRGDVSVVNFGANPATLASIRSADAMAALTELGNEVIVAALVEWRDYTLLTLEVREGKTLSSATREVLSNVAGLIDDAGGLLDDLLAVSNPESDEAGDSVERSIDNEKGLCAAIRAVIREPAKDEQRAEIITRARELELPGLIPGDWTAAGALPDGRALDVQEQRETYNDTYTALDGALDEALVTNGDYWYVWVQDFTDTDVIYSVGGDLYSAPYTLVPGGECTVDVGNATKVRPVTEYVDRGAEEPEKPEARDVVVLPDFSARARQRQDVLRVRGGRR